MVLSPCLICNIFPNYCQSYSINQLATKSGKSEDTACHELWKASHLVEDGEFFDDASKNQLIKWSDCLSCLIFHILVIFSQCKLLKIKLHFCLLSGWYFQKGKEPTSYFNIPWRTSDDSSSEIYWKMKGYSILKRGNFWPNKWLCCKKKFDLWNWETPALTLKMFPSKSATQPNVLTRMSSPRTMVMSRSLFWVKPIF